MRARSRAAGVNLIPLVAPTSSERIARIVSGASGFVYCVSSLGVTGERSSFHSGVDEFIASVRLVYGPAGRCRIRNFYWRAGIPFCQDL